MSINLTTNAIPSITSGDLNLRPLVQVLDIKLIGQSQDRYRLLISDSVFTQQAMLATQLNDKLKTGVVRKGSVVQLVDYICSTVQNRKIIVVLNLETIVPECDIIGNPRPFVESAGSVQKPLQPANGNNYAAPPINPNNNNNNNNNDRMQPSVQPRQNVPQTYQPRPMVQPAYQPPPPSYNSHGPIMKNEAAPRIIPINALNPYQGRWAIKARVTAKGDLRRYNNARGDGKVFSFDLLDSDGGEIRATCFNTVVDKFYDYVEVGKVYMVSKGSLKAAQKNFNHLNNEWEITLENASTVELCPDEDSSIPQQQFSFKPISDVESTETNAILDVIGVVTSVNPSVSIMRKNGMETQRRILSLKDQSGKSVEFTLWGDFCNREGRELQEMVDSGDFPVLAVKAGKVSDFSGKSLGSISASQLFVNPDFPEAHRLKDWFDKGGRNIASQSISKDMMPKGGNEMRKTISQIRQEGLGMGDKADWVTVKASISFVKTDNFCYTACPLMNGDRQCAKKVSKNGEMWHCERCNQDFVECDYRYLISAQVQDHTGLTWVTAFQEAGEEMLGCSAKELYSLKHEEQDDTRFEEIIRSHLFNQYLFKLKIKEESYGDEKKIKITVVKAESVNPSSEGKYMLDFISGPFR